MIITLQIACDDKHIPSKKLFTLWLTSATSIVPVKTRIPLPKITLRIVDKTESQKLNKNFRKKNKPTNVLSFPPNEIPGFKNDFLGDLALCASVIAEEAAEQDKELQAHWAHMTIHGFLHLLGYDHIKEAEAEEMEALEVRILQDLGHSNPY